MTGVATRNGGAWVRLAACLALAVFVGAQLLTGLHFALVRHTLCPEGGGLVHAAPALEAPAVAGVSSPAPDGRSHASPDQSPRGYERCALPRGAIPSAVSAASQPFEVRPSGRSVEFARSWGQAAVMSIALLALAPKQSPPGGRA